jgi:hypothetical protein
MQKIQHKRGDTWEPACTFRNADGVATDYSALGITITSQVRTPAGKLIANLTVAAAAGTGNFTTTGATASWPLGNLHWDIQFTQSGKSFSTQTAVIEMVKDVTQ